MRPELSVATLAHVVRLPNHNSSDWILVAVLAHFRLRVLAHELLLPMLLVVVSEALGLLKVGPLLCNCENDIAGFAAPLGWYALGLLRWLLELVDVDIPVLQVVERLRDLRSVMRLRGIQRVLAMAAVRAGRGQGHLLVRAGAVVGGCSLLADVQLVLREPLLVEIQLRAVLASDELLDLLQARNIQLAWHHRNRWLLLVYALLCGN